MPVSQTTTATRLIELLSQHVGLSIENLNSLSADQLRTYFLETAVSEECDPSLLALLLDADDEVTTVAMGNDRMPLEALKSFILQSELYESSDVSAALNHPNMTSEFIGDIARGEYDGTLGMNDDLREYVFANVEIPYAVLEELVGDGTDFDYWGSLADDLLHVRNTAVAASLLGEDVDLSPQQLSDLSQDEYHQLCLEVAEDDDTGPEELNTMSINELLNVLDRPTIDTRLRNVVLFMLANPSLSLAAAECEAVLESGDAPLSYIEAAQNYLRLLRRYGDAQRRGPARLPYCPVVPRSWTEG